MADFATLAARVDFSQLDSAKASLKQFATAAQQSASQNARVQTSLKGMEDGARRAARATDIITAGMEQFNIGSQKVASSTKTATQTATQMVMQLHEQVAGYEALRASLDPVFAASQRYENAVDQINLALSDNLIRQSEANRMMDLAAQRFLGLESAAERMAQAEAEHASELARLSSGYDSVRASVDPLFAASKQYESALEQVNAAVQAGVVSQTQANQVMDLAAQRYISVGRASTGLMKNMSPAQQQNLKNFAFQLNQIGQQGAVTGNYLGALAIQIPDMATAFGFAGIMAGGLLAVLGPLAVEMIKGEDAAKKSKTEIHALAAALDGLAATSQASAEDISRYVTSTFSDLGDEVQALIDDLREAEFSVLSNQMRHEVEAVTTELTRLGGAFEVFWEDFNNPGQIDQGYLEDINKIIAQSGVAYDEFLRLESAVEAVFEARSVNEFIGSLADARDLAAEIGGPVGDSVADALLQAADDAGLLERFLASAKGEAEGASGAASRLAGKLSAASQYAAQLAANLGAAPAGLAGLQNRAEVLTAQIAALDEGYGKVGASVAGYRKELEQKYGLTEAANAAEEAYISAIINREVAAYESVQNLNEGYTDRISELNKTARAAGGGAGASKKLTDQLKKEIEQYERAADPMRAYNAEMARLDELLAAGLSDGAYAAAVQDLNSEFANSLPIISDIRSELIDAFTDGIDSVGDFFGAIMSGIRRVLATRFVDQLIGGIAPGMVGAGAFMGGGVAGKALAGGGGMGFNPLGLLGVGNTLSGGGLLSGVGGLMAGSGSGFVAGLGGTLASGNVLGASFSALGSIAGGGLPVGAGVGAFGAALPALGIVGAGLGLLVSGIIGKTKELDRGIRLTVDNMDLLVESFQVVEKSRFFGLSKSVKTNLSEITGEDADVFVKAVDDIQGGILDASEALGMGASAFNDFAYTMDISTKGMEEAEAQAAILEGLGELSDAMAEFALAGHDVALEGETATQTLNRLASDLTVVNDALQAVGRTLFDVGIEGAAAASEIAQAFGGAGGFATAFETYLTGFYTQAERADMQVAQLEEAFADLNITMPTTRAGFRGLVESIDLTTAGGRELYAELLSLAGAMDQVLPSIASLNEQLYGMVIETNGQISEMIRESQNAARESARAADAWYRTADSLRDFMGDLMGTDLGGRSTANQMAFLQTQYETTLASAMAGDQQAAQDFPGVARELLNAARGMAGSAEEYAATAAKVTNETQLLSGVATLEGAVEDVLQDLYMQQIDVLEQLADFLTLEGLTEEQIASLDENLQAFVNDWDGTVAMFDAALGDLTEAIDLVSSTTYAALMERADISVEVLANSNSIPTDIKNLMLASVEGITLTIDTILRQDLPPDILWLAINAESQHLKTIELLLDQTNLTPNEMRLALATADEVTKTVNILLNADLTEDELRLALASTGELARVINLTLADDIPPGIRRLALENIGDYLINIQLSTLPEIPEDIRRLVLEDASSYALIVEVALDLPKDEAFLLLDAASIHVRTVQAVLLSNADIDKLLAESPMTKLAVNPLLVTDGLTEREQQIILGASSDALLMMTVSLVYPDLFTEQELDLMQGEAAAVLFTSLALAYPGSLTRQERHLFEGSAAAALKTALSIAYPDMTSMERDLARGGAETALRAVMNVLYRDLTGMERDLLTERVTEARRDITAKVGISASTVGRQFLSTLTDYSARTDRTIDGLLDLPTLTDEQRGFLTAVSGAHAGKVTLAGGVVLDPSTAFQQWYGDTTRENMTGPMAELRSSLDELRDVMSVVADQYRLTSLETQLASAYNTQQSMMGGAQGLIDQIYDLEDQTGVQLMNDGKDAVLRMGQHGQIVYKWTDVAVSAGSDTDTFGDAFWSQGGLEDQVLAYNSAFWATQSQINVLRQQIESLGGVPAFASGGYHAGGWALVGERGPELAHFGGPAQIYNAQQSSRMMGSSDGGSARELKEMREMMQQLLLRIEENTYETKEAEERKRIVGAPVTFVDGETVSVEIVD